MARRASSITPEAASASWGSTLKTPQNAPPSPPQTANFTELAVSSICRQTAAITPPRSCRSAGQALHVSGTRRSKTAPAQGSEGAATTSASSLARPVRPWGSASPLPPRSARAARSWARSPGKQNRAVQTGPTAAGGSNSWMILVAGCHRATASRTAGRRHPAAAEATPGQARGGRTTLAPTAGQAPRSAA
ncbi:TPA_asm: UL7.5 [Human alphaherpesvirus 1]|nr:TPA_asm: UL7.5 [Human alphaherpesvirus 1]